MNNFATLTIANVIALATPTNTTHAQENNAEKVIKAQDDCWGG